MKRLLPGLLVVLALGCEEGPPRAASPVEEAPPAPAPDAPDPATPEPTAVAVGPGTEAELAPPLEPEPVEAPARQRRRMNVDQLAVAMRQVSGGIGWTERRGNNEFDLFEELSITLGKPDYIQRTNEDLSPSALFQKFLDDAARSICERMIEREPRLAPAGDVDVDEHLRELVRRFHGRLEVPEVAAWRWLYQSARFVGGEPTVAWHGVCVALFTHPDFYTY